MQRYGPDSLNSWLISFSCCFINMMLYGMARISGILFVASISRFNVSRQKASFPYTFDNFMRNTSGPLVGFLGHRYGVRAVTTVGCLLGAIGAGTCYFAENIETVTVLWGAIFGLGFGLGSILLPVSVNQHFDKHRATASGISFSGACLGSFVLPPIVEILLNNYGLSGTYLFLAGFILNCVPAALLLKQPSFDIKTNPCDSDESETLSIVSDSKVKLYTVEDSCQNRKTISNFNSEINILDKKRSNLNLTRDDKVKTLSTQTFVSECSIRTNVSETPDTEETESHKGRPKFDPKVPEPKSLSMSYGSTDQNAYFEILDGVWDKDFRISSSFQFEKPVVPINRARSLSTEHIFPNNHAYLKYGYNTSKEDSIQNNETVNKNMIKTRDIFNDISLSPQNISETFAVSSSDKSSNRLKCFSENLKLPPFCGKQFSKNADWSNDDHSNISIVECPSNKTFCLTGKKSSLGSFSIIFDPMFILIAITNAIYCFTFVCVITVVVDFARDLHVTPSKQKYIIMSMSVGDIIGRLSLGWITDRGYMTTTGFAALCYACQGLITAAIAWSSGFLTLIICVSLYGLSESGIIVIYPIIIAQYIDHDKQTVAIPSSNFLSGPLCLAVAPLIGYFRDEIGAYDYVFYGLSILSGVCCLSLLLAPFVARYRTRSRVRQSD